MKKHALVIISAVLFNLLSQAHSFSLPIGKPTFSIGAFSANHGAAQHINIEDLIGNDYTVTDKTDQNFLLGLGYFIDGANKGAINLAYGINAFFLAATDVHGMVVQENLFNNLSYQYSVIHRPVLVAAKATIKTKSENYAVTLDAGIGPNFMNINNYHEQSLDGGVTLPDNAFLGHTSTQFSASAGIGIKFDNAFGSVPVELGYRFFYLGKSELNPRTNQILGSLTTGTIYANALVLTVAA